MDDQSMLATPPQRPSSRQDFEKYKYWKDPNEILKICRSASPTRAATNKNPKFVGKEVQKPTMFESALRYSHRPLGRYATSSPSATLERLPVTKAKLVRDKREYYSKYPKDTLSSYTMALPLTEAGFAAGAKQIPQGPSPVLALADSKGRPKSAPTIRMMIPDWNNEEELQHFLDIAVEDAEDDDIAARSSRTATPMGWHATTPRSTTPSGSSWATRPMTPATPPPGSRPESRAMTPGGSRWSKQRTFDKPLDQYGASVMLQHLQNEVDRQNRDLHGLSEIEQENARLKQMLRQLHGQFHAAVDTIEQQHQEQKQKIHDKYASMAPLDSKMRRSTMAATHVGAGLKRKNDSLIRGKRNTLHNFNKGMSKIWDGKKGQIEYNVGRGKVAFNVSDTSFNLIANNFCHRASFSVVVPPDWTKLQIAAGDTKKESDAIATRRMCREEQLSSYTGKRAIGFVKANVVCLPAEDAHDLLNFCMRNSHTVPVLDVCDSAQGTFLARGSDVRMDCPGYWIFRDGELCMEKHDIRSDWQPDDVAFFVSSNSTLDGVLLQNGIALRHVEEMLQVPMFITDIPLVAAGRFGSCLVVQMIPILKSQLAKVLEITNLSNSIRVPPLIIGDATSIGIHHLAAPDFGSPIDLMPDEVPCFWPSSAGTLLEALRDAHPKVSQCCTNIPGHDLATDLKESDWSLLVSDEPK
mmetsp:Transcript_26707/g.60992  ORF Transcript_26707/g.60992 Transcript_26707/m.60992 type:complete len:694 (-) Transcript_26707:145-2226(-)|eukprot:CAMPEP_0204331568 /NCGR_PEP_ID=MMETSP0469-20131031/15806_1 /ASSEMBLY_ACC=CAM_ASM_000384 /TAXON_ID=2969 /ORGANISM="Oxyrrhis marina" /LENGTH=693 /DNA_ID=CAMNT_0051314597 /DNA_START=105 /DNA_END=2186 /DNA_ORIENTATION=-